MPSRARPMLLATAAVVLATTSLAPVTPATHAATVSPADPLASPSTANLLSWLAQLPSRGKTASGYFAGYSANTTSQGGDASGISRGSAGEIADVEQATQQSPTIVACDYGVLNGAGTAIVALNYACNSYLESAANQGHVVSVSVHFPDPGQTSCANARPMTEACSGHLTNPATPTGSAWDRELSVVAAGLAQLATYRRGDGQVGIPVLFRPLMEMNDRWAWWGNQPAADFRAVWKNMFSVISADLTSDINAANPSLGANSHNVLWVYAPDCHANSPQADYPGAGYVDVVGLDCYPPESTSSQTTSFTKLSTMLAGYAALTGLAKPFAFTEIGASPAGRQGTPSYNFGPWLAYLHADFPKACYFLSWNANWGYKVAESDPSDSNINSFTELMNGPGIVNLNRRLPGRAGAK